jgi:hypothetical protein
MRRTAMTVAMMASASFGLGACGGQVVIGGAEPGDGGTGTARLEAGAGRTTGASGGGAAAPTDAAPTDDGGAGIDSSAQTATMAADVVLQPANAEVTLCQIFANPFGRDVDLVSIDGATNLAHDMFIFSLPPSTGQTQPTSLTGCTDDPLGVQPFLYYSDQSHLTLTYPLPNLGYPLAADNLLMVRVHYLNPSNAPIQAHATFSLSAAKPGSVTIHVGRIFLRYSQFAVAAMADAGPVIASNSATPVEENYFTYGPWSFSTPAGAEVRVTADGTALYDFVNSGEFSPPPSSEPTNEVGMAQNITWSCTYAHPGQSQAEGQCAYQAYYYPADPKNADRIVDVVPP